MVHLADLMQQYGVEQVQTRTCVVAFHTDPQIREYHKKDTILAFRTLVPFLRKWINVPANYDTIYQQMGQEIQQPEFEARMTLLTAWGINYGVSQTSIAQ